VKIDRSQVGIWLINLPGNTDRRRRMESQLSEMGLRWNYFSAVDGREQFDELKARADVAAYSRNMGSPILPGKLGVFASHTTVWKEFLASEYRVALVLEDDVLFHEDFLECLDAALSIHHQWDLVRFNCVRAKIPVSQGHVERWSLNAYIGPFTGNACYLIHRDVAAHLSVNVWPQTRALDHELNRFFVHNYRQLGLEPWASHTDDGNVSTITGVGFASVKKYKWYLRLPHYGLKLSNYFKRSWWLLRRGMLFKKNRKLL